MTTPTEQAAAPARFRDGKITFANGAAGEHVDVPSANPGNYHEAITRPDSMAKVTLDGKLFLPPGVFGASLGRTGDQARQFRDDMVAFFARTLA